MWEIIAGWHPFWQFVFLCFFCFLASLLIEESLHVLALIVSAKRDKDA